jgi:uncharacterized protein with PIN domain
MVILLVALSQAASPRRRPQADCFAYALAKDTAEPLLAKGGDFQKTDLVLAGS